MYETRAGQSSRGAGSQGDTASWKDGWGGGGEGEMRGEGSQSSTYLMRVGAMRHSGFANYGAGREKQREISEVTSPQRHLADTG